MISSGLTIFVIGFLALIVALTVFDKFRSAHWGWSVSKSRLMSCQKCHHVFLAKRHEQHPKCPKCGEGVAKFRPPQGSMRTRGGR